MDYALIILFLCMFLLAIFAHLERQREIRSRIALSNSLVAEQERMQELLLRARADGAENTTPQSASSSDGTLQDAQQGTSSGDADALFSPVGAKTSTTSTSSEAEGASSSTPTYTPYPRYADVTAVRYENTRLGFVMELPLGWDVAYERGEDIVFSSEDHSYSPTLEEIQNKEGALWLRVTRPCVATQGDSALFAFSSSTGQLVREASSCVAPFLVTLGLRADVPDSFAREVFLLNLGRTFYPMVSPNAPYAPIR